VVGTVDLPEERVGVGVATEEEQRVREKRDGPFVAEVDGLLVRSGGRFVVAEDKQDSGTFPMPVGAAVVGGLAFGSEVVQAESPG
jgi:hypothetical protein